MKNLIPSSLSLPTLWEDEARTRELFGSPTSIKFPQVDLEETDHALVVKADVPNLDKKDISIEVQDHALIISGEKMQEKEEHHKKYYYRERSSQSFRREITLPKEILKNQVSAKMHSGVLTVTLPKSESASKAIPIEG